MTAQLCEPHLKALSRLEYTYDGLSRHLLVSILSGVLSVQGVAMVLGLFGRPDPWWQPHTAARPFGECSFASVKIAS